MNRKTYFWKLRESGLQAGTRTLIMGILNVTPDSFSDGGRFDDPDRAYARALELEEQGADIIDIGAESTRPGSHRISADEEWQRLVPVLKRLRGNVRVVLSLDTYKSEIAERALQYGVQIFNDPSGLTFDSELARVAAHANVGLIINHMRGQPEMWSRLGPMQNPLGTIAKDLDAAVNRARRAGVDRGRIVIDPGFGFGKRKEQNIEILARLGELSELDCPILVGPSRKSFLAKGGEGAPREATAAAVTAAILQGAHIVRVHDVSEMRAVADLSDEILRATAQPEVARPPTSRRTTPQTREREEPRERKEPRPMRDGWQPPVFEKRPERAEPSLRGERPHGAERGSGPPRKFGDGERRSFRDAPPQGREFRDRTGGPRGDLSRGLGRPERPERGAGPPRKFGDGERRSFRGGPPQRPDFRDRSGGARDEKSRGPNGPERREWKKKPFRKRP